MGFEIKKKKGPIAAINVTPLVDVMLVLLIIFMIAAPSMFSGIKLNLPKTKKVNRIQLTQEQVILSMSKKGEFFLGKIKVEIDSLAKKAQELLDKTTSKTLYLRADYNLEYGSVAKIMAILKKAGIDKIALVTEQERNDKK